MRALLLKEWRENRWLIVGFLALAPVVSVAVKWALLDWQSGLIHDSLTLSIPIVVGLFAAAIAGDLVARECSSGTIEFYAALPARPSTVWLTKLLFLLAVTALFLGYVLLTETAILLVSGNAFASHYVWSTLENTDRAAAILLLASGVLFYSTLIDRGFAAVIAAFATLAGIGVVIWTAVASEVSPSQRHEPFLWTAALLSGGFLLGSYLAFTRGRIHLGSRLRRVVLAAGALLLVAAPPAAWAGARIVHYRDVTPSDRDLKLLPWKLTDDGEWITVYARLRGDPPFGLLECVNLWAVHLEDGRLRDLDRFCDVYGSGNFVTAGKATLEFAGDGEITRYDVAEGRSLAVRAAGWEELNDLSLRSLEGERNVYPGDRQGKFRRHPRRDLPDGWYCGCAWNAHGAVVDRPDEEGYRHGLWVADRNEVVPLPDLGQEWWSFGLMPTDPSGAALVAATWGTRRDDLSKWRYRLFRVPLDGSAPEEVRSGRFRILEVAPDCRRAILLAEGGPWILDARDASVRRLDVPDQPYLESRVLWNRDSRRFLLFGKEGSWLCEVEEDGVRTKRIPLPPIPGVVSHFRGDRFLHLFEEDGGGALEVIGLDGKVTRLLPRR